VCLRTTQFLLVVCVAVSPTLASIPDTHTSLFTRYQQKMASAKGFDTCCFKSFAWDGTPVGHEGTLASNPTYITGSNASAAVLFVHDALGWKFGNARLLADHFAKEANVTVYLPDFFGGEPLDAQKVMEGRWEELDLEGFKARNSREIREPEIFACAKALREKGYGKIGTVGYCYGGWAVLRLASEGLGSFLVPLLAIIKT
jgi:hypothetical protein